MAIYSALQRTRDEWKGRKGERKGLTVPNVSKTLERIHQGHITGEKQHTPIMKEKQGCLEQTPLVTWTHTIYHTLKRLRISQQLTSTSMPSKEGGSQHFQPHVLHRTTAREPKGEAQEFSQSGNLRLRYSPSRDGKGATWPI